MEVFSRESFPLYGILLYTYSLNTIIGTNFHGALLSLIKQMSVHSRNSIANIWLDTVYILIFAISKTRTPPYKGQLTVVPMVFLL